MPRSATDEDASFGDFIEDKSAENPSDMTSYSLLKDKLDDVLASLNERERKILELRFGLVDGYGRTLEEVGQIYKVTRERIRQIEAKAFANCVTRRASAISRASSKPPKRLATPARHDSWDTRNGDSVVLRVTLLVSSPNRRSIHPGNRKKHVPTGSAGSHEAANTG